MSELLKAENIHKIYRSPSGKLPVLKGVSLTLQEGEITCITGRSGSGKSTMLHVLGLLDQFDSGNLYFRGERIERLSDRKHSELRNKSFGFVFQFYNLLPELNVFENAVLPGVVGRVRDAAKTAHMLLDRVGLTERVKHFPHQLSGGEQQRVALVRALVNRPAVVFCDEPTGNLDDKSSDIVMDLIHELNHEHKQTFCIVTHDTTLVKGGVHSYHLRGGVLE